MFQTRRKKKNVPKTKDGLNEDVPKKNILNKDASKKRRSFRKRRMFQKRTFLKRKDV